jgi:hypothetical protein
MCTLHRTSAIIPLSLSLRHMVHMLSLCYLLLSVGNSIGGITKSTCVPCIEHLLQLLSLSDTWYTCIYTCYHVSHMLFIALCW